jgi:hypothetical protein
VVFIPQQLLQRLDRVLTLLRMMRGYGLRHYELNKRSQTAVADRADLERQPAEAELFDQKPSRPLSKWLFSLRIKSARFSWRSA